MWCGQAACGCFYKGAYDNFMSEAVQDIAQEQYTQEATRLAWYQRAGAFLATGALVLGPNVGANAVDEPTVDAAQAVATTEAPSDTPNTIVFLVDDMNDFKCKDTRKYLPLTSRWLKDQGTCFENTTVTSPVCCPARGQIMTGQMPHNNGVERQIDSHNLQAGNTIQHALTNKGLATYGVGKFLNSISPQEFETGQFDFGFEEGDFWVPVRYKDYTLYTDDGVGYTPERPLHATKLAGNYSDEFVKEKATEDEPFYLYTAFQAPHTQQNDKTAFGNSNKRLKSIIPVATGKNQNADVAKFKYNPEKNTEDKLPFLSADNKAIFHKKSQLERLHKARLRALLDVDFEMARVFKTLEQTGELDDTAVYFLSDNGYHLGENSWDGKALPYPASINVPMLAYKPGIFPAGHIDRRDVSLADLAPTIYDIYDIQPAYTVDGHSLLSNYSRKEQYNEYKNEKSVFTMNESGSAPSAVPDWHSYTRNGQTYIEFRDHTGKLIQREFYKDPGMERNLLYWKYKENRPSDQKLARFKAKLLGYQSCAGTVELGSPNPCP
jgi:N-acetylglucosamine-6-sulfatase